MRYAVGSALVCYYRFKVKMRDLFFSLKKGSKFGDFQRFSTKVYQRNKIKTKLVNQLNRKTWLILSVGTVKRDKVELKAIKEGALSYASLEKK
ncbi:unnamed protein product, partial [Brassica rapa]